MCHGVICIIAGNKTIGKHTVGEDPIVAVPNIQKNPLQLLQTSYIVKIHFAAQIFAADKFFYFFLASPKQCRHPIYPCVISHLFFSLNTA